jgi:hypothetical protein
MRPGSHKDPVAQKQPTITDTLILFWTILTRTPQIPHRVWTSHTHWAVVAHIHIERAQCVAHIELQLLTFTLSVLNLSDYNLWPRWISRGSSPYLGTLGGGKGMRQTRVE